MENLKGRELKKALKRNKRSLDGNKGIGRRRRYCKGSSKERMEKKLS